MKKTILLISISVFILCQVAMAQEFKTTKSGYLAAITEEIFDKTSAMVAAKDFEAVQKLIDAGVVIWLKEGMKVQVLETTWTGKIKIRPKGGLVEVWTYFEAVR